MATDQDLIRALCSVAKELLQRPLQQNELGSLVHHFNISQGTVVERAVKSLSACTGMTLDAILEKRDVSDETDKVMCDLENVLMEWRVDSDWSG